MQNLESTELRARLARLEHELLLMRRELGERRSSPVFPEVSFQALHIRLGGTEYAVATERVREIVRYAELAEVSNCPRPVRGILNLRGKAIVVLDVAERLGVGRITPDLRTPIVVAASQGREVGLLVERVVDVMTLDPATFEEPSGVIASSVYVAALGEVDGKLIQILDLECLFSDCDLNANEALLAAENAMSESTESDDGWTA